MKSSTFPLFSVILTLFVLGCTTVPSGVEIHAITAQVKIYEPDQLPRREYKVIGPLWTDSSSIPLWGPEYKTMDEGVTALQLEANRLGANGLTNVGCFHDGKILSLLHWTMEPVFTCYGEAITVGRVAR